MRVPIYKRKQGIAPLPAVNVSPAYSPSDNGASTGQAIQNIAARLQKINDDTEDARTLELMNKFKAESQEYHENPDKGIYNTRLGYQSRGVYKEADEWLRRKGEDYARELGARGKYNFRRMAEEYIQQRGLQNSRFEADQMKKYQAEQADATIKNGINEVAANPYDDEAVELSRKNMLDALELKLRWATPEAKRLALAELENNIAAARLNVMMNDNPIEAEKWFNENRSSFTPDNALKFQAALKNATKIYKVQSVVDQLIKKFPQGHEADALKWIRENFSGDTEERIASAYKTRANEIVIDLNRNARLLKLQQDELEERLLTNFYLNGTLPSDGDFKQMVSDGRLRVEQAERLQNRGNIFANRSRIEQQILSANPDLSQLELDTAVMRTMGTTQDEYQRTFAAAVQAVMSGEADDNILNYYYQRGKLTKNDVERIKKHSRDFDDVQKSYFRAEQKDLDSIIKTLVASDFPEELTQGIRDKFIAGETLLNPKSKSYREDLLKLKKRTLIDAIDSSGARLNGYLWGRSTLGENYDIIQNLNLNERGIDPLPTLPNILPSPIDLNNSNVTAGENIPLQMVAGGVVTKGGDFYASRAYRKGNHNGLDIAAPEGTNIIMQDYGTPLTVTKINTATPTKGAGNSVTLSGTYDNGDIVEITLGHMANNSINVTQGQTVDVGTIIGDVGNTGMTSENGKITPWREDKKTGYHVDVKIKLNGKYVDPAKFRPPTQKRQNNVRLSPNEIFAIPNYEDL